MESKSLKFSVICPIYNRATSICNIVNSVYCQNYDNFELIFIDDGSTDETKEIIKKYSTNDCRIRYFYQENKGPFFARLLGLKNVTGDYFLFLDSDDFLLPNCLRVLKSSILTHNFPDVMLFNFKRNEGRIYSDQLNRFDLISNSTDPLNELFVKTTSYFLWDKCYKKELINKANFEFKFYFRRFGEDTLMLYELVKNSNSLIKIDDILYQYTYTENSLVRNKNREDMIGQKNIYTYIYNDLSKNYKHINDLIINQIFDFHIDDLTYFSKILKFKNWKSHCYNFKDIDCFINFNQLHTKKKKIFCFLFRIKFYYFIYIIFKFFI